MRKKNLLNFFIIGVIFGYFLLLREELLLAFKITLKTYSFGLPTIGELVDLAKLPGFQGYYDWGFGFTNLVKPWSIVFTKRAFFSPGLRFFPTYLPLKGFLKVLGVKPKGEKGVTFVFIYPLGQIFLHLGFTREREISTGCNGFIWRFAQRRFISVSTSPSPSNFFMATGLFWGQRFPFVLKPPRVSTNTIFGGQTFSF